MSSGNRAICNSPEQEPYVLYRATYLLGQCYVKMGRFGDAVESLTELNLRMGCHQLYWALPAVKKHYFLGLAYEKSGWVTQALGEYNRFLEIWKEADPGIKEVDDARDRMAQLKSQQRID